MIRPATGDDLSWIVALEKRRFTTDAWTPEQWEYELKENEFARVLVLEEAGSRIAFLDYWILFEQATVNKLAVEEAFARRGYGLSLLEEGLRRIDETLCASTTLEVRISNDAALALYEKAGFRILLRKPGYYNDGEDAFFMQRTIGGSI